MSDRSKSHSTVGVPRKERHEEGESRRIINKVGKENKTMDIMKRLAVDICDISFPVNINRFANLHVTLQKKKTFFFTIDIRMTRVLSL